MHYKTTVLNEPVQLYCKTQTKSGGANMRLPEVIHKKFL